MQCKPHRKASHHLSFGRAAFVLTSGVLLWWRGGAVPVDLHNSHNIHGQWPVLDGLHQPLGPRLSRDYRGRRQVLVRREGQSSIQEPQVCVCVSGTRLAACQPLDDYACLARQPVSSTLHRHRHRAQSFSTLSSLILVLLPCLVHCHINVNRWYVWELPVYMLLGLLGGLLAALWTALNVRLLLVRKTFAKHPLHKVLDVLLVCLITNTIRCDVLTEGVISPCCM